MEVARYGPLWTLGRCDGLYAVPCLNLLRQGPQGGGYHCRGRGAYVRPGYDFLTKYMNEMLGPTMSADMVAMTPVTEDSVALDAGLPLHVRSNAEKTNHALVLVKTPFQAWLVEKVLQTEKVATYDLLYFTQNDSEEDRFYYGRLAENACAARFVFVPRQARDLLNHVRFALSAWPFVFGKRYDASIVSSIDSYVLNAVANRCAAGQLVTFDDGAANYNQEGAYFRDPFSWRARNYRRLFRAKSITETRARVTRHYTIHPNLKNIVDEDRLHTIAGWEFSSAVGERTGSPKIYFIGAPFQILSSRQINLLESHARGIGVDVYVRHPREREPLDLAVPFLEKWGKIAEEAILDDAVDRPIVLVGSLSSVMFNLASCADRRIIFVPRDLQRHGSLIDLARKSGCEILLLDGLE